MAPSEQAACDYQSRVVPATSTLISRCHSACGLRRRLRYELALEASSAVHRSAFAVALSVTSTCSASVCDPPDARAGTPLSLALGGRLAFHAGSARPRATGAAGAQRRRTCQAPLPGDRRSTIDEGYGVTSSESRVVCDATPLDRSTRRRGARYRAPRRPARREPARREHVARRKCPVRRKAAARSPASRRRAPAVLQKGRIGQQPVAPGRAGLAGDGAAGLGRDIGEILRRPGQRAALEIEAEAQRRSSASSKRAISAGATSSEIEPIGDRLGHARIIRSCGSRSGSSRSSAARWRDAMQREGAVDEARRARAQRLHGKGAEMLLEPRPPAAPRRYCPAAARSAARGRAPAAHEAEMAAMPARHQLQNDRGSRRGADADDEPFVPPIHAGCHPPATGRKRAGRGRGFRRVTARRA